MPRTRAFRTIVTLSAFTAIALVYAQSVQDSMKQADAAYNRKDYATAATIYMKVAKSDPKQTLAIYNGACCYALLGEKDKAFEVLDTLVANGYNNPDRLNEDTDFQSIREDARWGGLIAKATENAKKNPPRKRFAPPYQILPLPTEPLDLASRLGTDGEGVWLDGDTLSFVIKSSAKSVRITGGIQQPMAKIPDSDLWLIQLKMNGWDKAIVSYGFFQDDKFPTAFKEWKGASAPELVDKKVELMGKVVERKFHSPSTGDDRTLVIYLPPNAPAKGLPAVFMADGQGCRDFARALEPLILAHKVRPCAIVGVPSGAYMGKQGEPYDGSKDLRALEYVPGMDADRFDRHMKFFTEEVGAYVAKEFGISTKRSDRAVTGFSNGGAFSAAVAFRKPSFFGVAMPLSLGIPPGEERPKGTLPRMYFAAGSLESFSVSTTQVYDLVRSWGIESSLDIYVAGHDSSMWALAFRNLMPKVFPVKP